jgi:PAS domain S-box-containing protein
LKVYGAEGTIIGAAAVARDITERKQVEQTLRESEERMQMALEVSRSFAFEWDLATQRVLRSESCGPIMGLSGDDARWIDVNDALCAMLGYSREELLAMPWVQITHPEDVESDWAPFRRMAAGELNSYGVEKRFIHKLGHHVWAQLTVSLVRDVDGRPDYEIAVIEDITERKRAQEALAAEEARLQAGLQSLPVAVWIADLKGTIVQMNKAVEQAWGRPARERCGIDKYGDYKGWFAEIGALMNWFCPK